MFEYADQLDEFRSWPIERVVAERGAVVREEGRLRTKKLALTRVLDERGKVDLTLASRAGVSERTLRDEVETARALESLPAVAAAAYTGEISAEQLGSVVTLADEWTDAEWAWRAPNTSPLDLARQARKVSKPTVADARARHEARGLKMWWTHKMGMLQIHGQLPDAIGAKFEATIKGLAEKMKPAKGQAWDSFEHRAADSLAGLLERDENMDDETPSLAAQPVLQVHVPLSGPAEIAGIPLPDVQVEKLRANAKIKRVMVDDDGTVLAVGKQFTVLSPKVMRAVLLRDGHCRCGNCDVHHGLQIHHLRPRSWGGDDKISNLAAVCIPAGHHQMLVPTGPWCLVGNPNRPDGLELVHLDDLDDEQAEQLGLPPRRAGPNAA